MLLPTRLPVMRAVPAVALCLGIAALAVVAPAAGQEVEVTLQASKLGPGDEFSAAVVDEKVYMWGDVTPYTTEDVDGRDVLSISSQANYSCMLQSVDNSVFCIGVDASDPRISGAPSDLSFLQLSAGLKHACGLTADFQYWDLSTQAPRESLSPADTTAFHESIRPVCWGEAVDNANTSYLTPANIGTASDPLAEVQVGETFTCVRTYTGLVSCDGVFPVDNTDAYTDTQAVVGPTTANPDGIRFSTLVTGNEHVCGVVTDGSLLCWGAVNSAAVGNAPTGTGFLGTPGALANGNSFSCALTTDRLAECWGFVLTFWDRQTPTTAFDAIAAGTRHVCGIRSEDSLVECWGFCGHGECVPPLILAPETVPCSELASGGTCMLFARNDAEIGSDLCSAPACSGFSWDVDGDCRCTRQTTDVWTFAGATPAPSPGDPAPSESLVRCQSQSRTVYRKFSCASEV